MMSVQFPEKISGQWIYLKRLKDQQDVSVLFRHVFRWESDLSDEAVLLVSANTSYRLFINGRLAGIGPRAHQDAGTSYIDAHEIGFYLEPGNNLISLYVHRHSDDGRGDFSRTPGMWCQLQCGAKTLLASDDSWELMALENINQPRARVAQGGRLSSFTDLRLLPADWSVNCKADDEKWEKPDMLVEPGLPGSFIELHPVGPASISAETVSFESVLRGRVDGIPGFSACVFPGGSVGKVAAAVSYVFCDSEKLFNVKFYSDDPCRLFCNRKKLFDGPCARGEEITIPLAKGLNRIVVFMKPRHGSMGFMFLNPEWPAELLFLSDMLDTAEPGWCTGTIGRLKYEECTPAVRIESLADLTVVPSNEYAVSDIWDWLSNARFSVSGAQEGRMTEGELALYTLPGLCYGSVRFSITASEGDIVDLIIGTEPAENGFFPHCANGNDRETVSCICREGGNVIFSLLPADCRCVLVYVRRTGKGVNIVSALFDELERNFNRECTFSCSDPFWNFVWQSGRDALSRSSVSLFSADGCSRHDFYLLDSFFESVNVAAVFGDCGYVTARLRQFAGGQLENGAVVSLSSGKGYDQALFHMFFFSGWILSNYRFSGNMVEMRSLMPKLDAARKYLISLLDEETFLLEPELSCGYEGSETDPVTTCRLPVVLNALFCRFMLSASEIYDLAERTFDARECRRFVRKVSAALVRNFYDAEVGLFSDLPVSQESENISFSLLGNFFPLLAGIKTEECFEKFVNTFFDFETASPRTVEAESPYFHYLFTEMLFALGQREWGFRYLENYWRQRGDAKSGVWKDPFTGVVKTSRFVDGNTLVPNVFLLREIVGVRIAEPAHSLIYFDPACAFLQQADAAIQTAYGRIHISWEKQPDGGLVVNVYSSHPLKVMPEMSEELLKKSLFRLSENVVLVRSAAKEG